MKNRRTVAISYAFVMLANQVMNAVFTHFRSGLWIFDQFKPDGLGNVTGKYIFSNNNIHNSYFC